MLILSVITVLLIFSIIIFSVLDKTEMVLISVILLIIFGVLGWGLYGILDLKSCYITKEKVEIFKSKSIIIVNFEDNHIEKYDKIKDFNEINDSTIFYKVNCYNMYGGSCLFTPNFYLYNNSKNSFLYNNINKKLLYSEIKKLVN